MIRDLLMAGAAFVVLSLPASAGVVTYSSRTIEGDPILILSPHLVGAKAGLITLNPGGYEEWCVDIFDILRTSSPLSSPYVLMTLAGGLPGVPLHLTHTQIGVMGSLMEHGDGLSSPDQFAATQIAIWEEEYGTFTYSGISSSVSSLAATYLYDARNIWSPDYNVIALVNSPGWRNQTLANVGGVPETSTWLMLMAGFGSLGLMGWKRVVRA